MSSGMYTNGFRMDLETIREYPRQIPKVTVQLGLVEYFGVAVGSMHLRPIGREHLEVALVVSAMAAFVL